MGNQIIKLLFSIVLMAVALLVGMMAFVTDTDAKASLKWPAVNTQTRAKFRFTIIPKTLNKLT